MRFRFRLERILDFLRLNETVKKMEVASLVLRLETLERQKQDREGALRRVLAESTLRLSESADWIPYQLNKVAFDTKHLALLEKDIGRAKEELEDKRFELGKLAMKRKGMENLREKQKQEFRVQENRKEQKAGDEQYRLTKSTFGR